MDIMEIPEQFSVHRPYSARIHHLAGATLAHINQQYIAAPNNSLMEHMIGQLLAHTGRVIGNLEQLCEYEDEDVPQRSLAAAFLHDWGQGDVYLHEIDKRHELRSMRDAEKVLRHAYGDRKCAVVLDMIKRHPGFKINKKSPFPYRCFKAADYMDSFSLEGHKRKITKKLAGLRQDGKKRPKSSDILAEVADRSKEKTKRCARLNVAVPYVHEVAQEGRAWLLDGDGREFIRELRDRFYACKRRKGIVYLKKK